MTIINQNNWKPRSTGVSYPRRQHDRRPKQRNFVYCLQPRQYANAGNFRANQARSQVDT